MSSLWHATVNLRNSIVLLKALIISIKKQDGVNGVNNLVKNLEEILFKLNCSFKGLDVRNSSASMEEVVPSNESSISNQDDSHTIELKLKHQETSLKLIEEIKKCNMLQELVKELAIANEDQHQKISTLEERITSLSTKSGGSINTGAEEDSNMYSIRTENADTDNEKHKSKNKLTGKYVLNEFPPNGWFYGIVKGYSRPYYKVVYEDGDYEEYDKDELAQLLVNVVPKDKKKLCEAQRDLLDSDKIEEKQTNLLGQKRKIISNDSPSVSVKEEEDIDESTSNEFVSLKPLITGSKIDNGITVVEDNDNEIVDLSLDEDVDNSEEVPSRKQQKMKDDLIQEIPKMITISSSSFETGLENKLNHKSDGTPTSSVVGTGPGKMTPGITLRPPHTRVDSKGLQGQVILPIP